MILITSDPKVLGAGLQAIDGENPLVYAATAENWEAMADLCKQHNASLAVKGDNLDELAEVTEKIKAKGVEDLVLDPTGKDLGSSLVLFTQIRRLALKKNFRAWVIL